MTVPKFLIRKEVEVTKEEYIKSLRESIEFQHRMIKDINLRQERYIKKLEKERDERAERIKKIEVEIKKLTTLSNSDEI